MTDAGIHWFAGLGYRPAVWTPPHRADGVDPERLIVAPDADVPLTKVDPYAHIPASGYAWGTWIWSPPDGHGKPQQLLTEAPETPPYYGHHVSTPQLSPWWPVDPLPPVYPCNCITTPPVNPPLPPVAPVPVPASGVLLIVALVGLGIIRGRAA